MNERENNNTVCYSHRCQWQTSLFLDGLQVPTVLLQHGPEIDGRSFESQNIFNYNLTWQLSLTPHLFPHYLNHQNKEAWKTFSYHFTIKIVAKTFQRCTWTKVRGDSLLEARTSYISLLLVPTRIFSPAQHTLRTDKPI